VCARWPWRRARRGAARRGAAQLQERLEQGMGMEATAHMASDEFHLPRYYAWWTRARRQ
jgi:hypothetical protein